MDTCLLLLFQHTETPLRSQRKNVAPEMMIAQEKECLYHKARYTTVTKDQRQLAISVKGNYIHKSNQMYAYMVTSLMQIKIFKNQISQKLSATLQYQLRVVKVTDQTVHVPTRRIF